MAIQIIDVFLGKVVVKKPILQLIGIVSLMIASKFHESYVYTLSLAYSHGAGLYTRDFIKTTEQYILKTLSWTLNMPTPSELHR